MVARGLSDGPPALPGLDEIGGATFASIDAFLGFQRAAVRAARLVYEADAAAVWAGLGDGARAAFARDLGAAPEALPDLWRRAWWLNAIGGAPRAPFEIATTAELAATLLGALRAAVPELPIDRRDAFDAWWGRLIAAARQRIAAYTAARVAGAARRLAGENLIAAESAARLADSAVLRADPVLSRREHLAVPTDRPASSARRRGRKSGRRVLDAAAEMVAAHRQLDGRFGELGAVCASCTRETGGCCSLTVPLIWREADFRLLALGGVEVPAPLDATAGACPFLGDQGCRLPAERRPHICRSFLCERAEQALGDELPLVRADLKRLSDARSRLGG